MHKGGQTDPTDVQTYPTSFGGGVAPLNFQRNWGPIGPCYMPSSDGSRDQCSRFGRGHKVHTYMHIKAVKSTGPCLPRSALPSGLLRRSSEGVVRVC